MSDSVLFDTQRYVDQLIEAGVPEQQAKAHAKGLVQLVESQFATRADMRDLDHKIDGVEERLSLRIDGIDAKIDGVEQRLDAKIDGVEQRLDAKIDGVEKSLNAKFDTTMWALGLMIAAFGILTSVLSVLH
ncbi:MAG TPA: hypothetical protein VFA48_02530 [Gammaproteobacteria bacterium]|nr:hypothetical protein [Gammaproteobacteria bacterium]